MAAILKSKNFKLLLCNSCMLHMVHGNMKPIEPNFLRDRYILIKLRKSLEMYRCQILKIVKPLR